MTATAMLLTASNAVAADGAGDVIGRPDFKTTTGVFDTDALMACGRLGTVALSPDGKTILYSVSYTDVAKNRSNADLYIA